MAAYPPPTEDLPIFDDSVFTTADNASLTLATASQYFLRFPNAQGNENLQTTFTYGLATFNGGAEFYDAGGTTNIIQNGADLVFTPSVAGGGLKVNSISNNGSDMNISAGGVNNNMNLTAGAGGGNINLTSGGYIDIVAADTITNICPNGAYFSTTTANPLAGDGIINGSAKKVALTSDNSNGTFYIPFSKTTTANNNPLYIDNTTSPLSYNPSTSTLTAATFNGSISTATNATQVSLTSDNSNGNFYIPYSQTTTANNNALYIDNTTSQLSYNPFASTLTATTFNGNASTATTATNATQVSLTSDNSNGVYYIPFSKTTTANKNTLFIDNATRPLNYTPVNSTLRCQTIEASVLLPSTSTTITFAGTTLTANFGTTASFGNFRVNISGTTNTISTLGFSNGNNNSCFTIAISNNGTGNLTINGVFLGTNIFTTDNTTLTIPSTENALLKVRSVNFFNGGVLYIVEKYRLYV